MRRLITCLLTFAALTATGTPWATPEEEGRLLQDMQAFFQGAETRYPGSPGNLAMEERVARRFADTGFEHGEIRFTAPTFIPGKTSLTLKGREPIVLLPMHPTLFRPGNFKEREFTSRLVYLGRGTVDDLDRVNGIDLQGAIALMEFDSGSAWLRFLRFGVRGFVFIGQEDCERSDALSKVYTSEVSVPRFFVEPEQGRLLKEAATAGISDGPSDLKSAPEVLVRAEPSRWENRFLRDLWVLIPGSDPDLSREICAITAPMDANCIVPEMATGAQAGANLYLLMQLLNHFQTNAPARSVILAAVNAHTQNFRGERMLAWYLLADGAEDVRNALSKDLREQQMLVDYYNQLDIGTFRQEDEDRLIAWRVLIDDTTGKNITVKNAVVALAKRDVNRMKGDQLRLLRQREKESLEETVFQARQKALDEARAKHVNVLTLFNKVGIRKKLGELSAEENKILKEYVDEVITFNRTAAELNERDLTVDKENSAIRNALKGRKVPFVVCLDLDWDSPQIGFCSMNVSGDYRWAFRWGTAACSIASHLDPVLKEGKANLLVDTMTMRGGLMERYYFSLGDFPIVQKSALLYFHNANRTPAFSLMNVFTAYGNAFLPADTMDRLNPSNLAQGMAFVPDLLRAIFDDRNMTTSSELPPADMAGWTFPMWSIPVKTFKFDELAASVYPDIPVSGSAVILRSENSTATSQPLWLDAITCGEVVNGDTALTDERAAVIIYGLREPGVSSAFHFDKDFVEVDHTIDAGDVHKKVDSNNLRADLMLALFNCTEFPIYATADSSMTAVTPIVVTAMLPLLGKGDSCPRKFGCTGMGSPFTSKKVNPTAGAPAAFYFSPGESIKLLTPYKRLALQATPKNYEGLGFESPSELGFDMFATMAKDMSVLNHARLKKLRDVANELVHEFLERGDQCLDRMNAAIVQKDHLTYLRSLYEALGDQVKSYEQAKQTCDDMLKAVVVYMALLLPFCFFVQKLLFKFMKIEHEMGMFAVLFVVTFVIFRMIHPAFRIAQAAEAIFIAFVMGALGLFVISILRGRFEGEMQLLFRSYLGGADEEVGYSTVTEKALLIGVNNMKRRRIRTMLTTATIVLIAFTMLSFTSISKKINPTIVTKSREVPYTGFMYRWPGKSVMDEATLNVFRDLFEKRGNLVVRRWLVAEDGAPFHVKSNTGEQARFEGILGLSKGEDGFLGPIPLTGGRYFSSDDAQEVIVSAGAADLLGIDPDQPESSRLSIKGSDLRVVGIFDDEQFRHMEDLNDLPLLPIKRIAKETAFGQDVGTVTTEDEEDMDEGLLSYVDTMSLLVLPAGLAERMGAGPNSVSVKLKAEDRIWPIADILLTATKAKFYMSSMFPFSFGAEDKKNVASGVYYVGSNYSTSVGGLAVLLIPLFIASTIILNTMLGSVYERKKEIAVYNAVGLNPHHIGMFFLAESFVYGVIGAVGGYLIGQVLSITLNQLGLVKDINLNYSSLSVAYVIMFTIAIVLLSTLYPASVATKAAVPSGKRKWSLPDHDGHTMNVIFPFIYHPHVAAGVLAYLHEYFSRFTETSIGDLVATPEKHSRTRDAQDRDRFSLEYHTALAPYDLGVTQRLIFELAHNDQVQAYRLTMRIVRVSGQDSNWVTTNRPFLERLRKYLIRWRSLDASQHGLYVQEANALFNEVEGG